MTNQPPPSDWEGPGNQVPQPNFPQPGYPPPGQSTGQPPQPGQPQPGQSWAPPTQAVGQPPAQSYGQPPAQPYAQPPAQPYGQPPAGQPGYLGGEQPKKRRIWPWILLAVFLLFFALIAGCSYLVFNFTRGPIDATNAFVANIDNKEYAAAYDSLCEAAQAQQTEAEWIADTQAEFDGEITGYTFNEVQYTGNVTTVTGTIDIDFVTRQYTFTLDEVGDEWRVCS